MFFLLLLASLIASSLSQNCAPGTIQLPEGGCAIVKQTGELNGYYEAEAVCQDAGGHLVSIQNAFVNSILVAYATGVNGSATNLYIGGDSHRNNFWTWIDRANMNYVNWAQGEPMSNTGCITMNLRDGKWRTGSCQQKLPYLCAIPIPTAPVCPTGWTFYNGNCYQMNFVTSSKRWADAHTACHREKAELASIHSDDENTFVLDLIRSVGILYPWIGLSCDGTSLRWTDGTKLTYTNFEFTTPPNNETAYSIDSTVSGRGRWSNVNEKYYFSKSWICKKPFSNSTFTESQKLPSE